MPSLIEAIEIKRKSYFEYENAPYHCLDVEVSKPTARGGQTLVRAEDAQPHHARGVRQDLQGRREVRRARPRDVGRELLVCAMPTAITSWTRQTFETLTLSADTLGEDRGLLVDNVEAQIHRYNGQPIGIVFPPHVELTVTKTEMGVRGNTASGSVTKTAVLETGLEIQVPLFIKEGEKVKVHTETREFAGRA